MIILSLNISFIYSYPNAPANINPTHPLSPRLNTYLSDILALSLRHRVSFHRPTHQRLNRLSRCCLINGRLKISPRHPRKSSSIKIVAWPYVCLINLLATKRSLKLQTYHNLSPRCDPEETINSASWAMLDPYNKVAKTSDERSGGIKINRIEKVSAVRGTPLHQLLLIHTI